MIQLLAMVFVGAGIALGAYGLSRYLGDRNTALRELLEAELEAPTKPPQDISDLMERAGAFAERALGQTQAVGRVRFKLIQAGSSIQAGEFGALLALGTLVVAALLLLITGSILLSLAAVVFMPLFAMSRLNSKARKRVMKMESQLPEALQLIAGSLDAGTSLLLGMELAGEEGEAPLSTEFARVVAESAVGRPLIEGLEAMVQRIGSKDIAWTVKAIKIQQQTGGKLADTLRVLADFMHARQEVRGEVRALSAEARISGKILIGMPIGLAAFLFLTRREYIEPLFITGPGRALLGAACVSLLFGHMWMKRLGRVEV
ncbi:MAG TPA: type II secretion system F family protein [Actinomycetota bacterium]|nr:type II secretion system F family protein [Actinomycetota bacterium]